MACLERLKKATRNFNYCRFLGWDSNQAPLKYKSEALPFEPTCWIERGAKLVGFTSLDLVALYGNTWNILKLADLENTFPPVWLIIGYTDITCLGLRLISFCNNWTSRKDRQAWRNKLPRWCWQMRGVALDNITYYNWWWASEHSCHDLPYFIIHFITSELAYLTTSNNRNNEYAVKRSTLKLTVNWDVTRNTSVDIVACRPVARQRQRNKQLYKTVTIKE
jgi:hypothetical protein